MSPSSTLFPQEAKFTPVVNASSQYFLSYSVWCAYKCSCAYVRTSGVVLALCTSLSTHDSYVNLLPIVCTSRKSMGVVLPNAPLEVHTINPVS